MSNELQPKELQTLQRIIAAFDGGNLTKAEFVTSFKNVVSLITRVSSKLNLDIEQFRTDFNAIKDDLKTTNKTLFDNAVADAKKTVADAIKKMIVEQDRRLGAMEVKVSQLENGKDADEEAMLIRLTALIPKIEDIESKLPMLGEKIRDSLELLQGKNRLRISAIDGLEEALTEAKKSGKSVGFVGGARGISVYVGGVKKGMINTLNFVAGSGIAISYSKVNGLDRITFTVSGSGVTVETPPEAANGSTTVFTVSAAPKWIVADGTTYYAGAGYSYSSLQVTMDIAPSSFIRAII